MAKEDKDLQKNQIEKITDDVPVNEVTENEEPVDVEIVDEQAPIEEEVVEEQHHDNLAEKMEEEELSILSADCIGEYTEDKSSRSDWAKTYTSNLDLLGFKYEERTKPFAGASGVVHPVLAEAQTQFQAQANKELLPADGPVRTKTIGRRTKEKVSQASRVKDFMNYQITDVMEEYDTDLDQMLFYLPLAGSAFKKIYYDEGLGRAVSKFVPAEDLVVPYLATDLESCERVTHVIKMMENELRKKQVSGFYRDIEVKPSISEDDDIKNKTRDLEGTDETGNNEEITILEFHVNLDLPGYEDVGEDGEPTGIKLPYIVTIAENNGKVLAIRRNWKEDNPNKTKLQYFVHFKFLPGLGFYGFGLTHMIGGLSRAATSALRQLIDAGTLSNLPAGFRAKGIRVKDDDEPLQPGEFRDVDAPGGDLRASFQLLPYKEPSAILFQLLGFCVQAGQRFAAIADVQVGDSNQQAPVGTTVALLERGSRVMSAIHKRLHYGQKLEFKLLAKVFSEYLPDEYPYEISGGERTIKQSDFDSRVDILPVSDPNIFSMSQRISLAQTQLELAKTEPGIHNVREAYRRMYEAIGTKDIEEILKEEPEAEPKDPALEYSDALDGRELVAFPGQNHDAHIYAHLIQGASPIVGQLPQLAISLQKHVMQHISLKADEGVQNIADPMQKEYQKALFISQYTQDMKELGSQLAGGNQPDPLVALKDKEINVKQQDLAAKQQQGQQKINLEKVKIGKKEESDKAKIESNEDIAELRGRIAREKIKQTAKSSGPTQKSSGQKK